MMITRDFYIAPYLRYSEIVSPDNDTGTLALDLLIAWVKLREEINRPIRIASGFRSVSHNRRVGGSPNSQHTIGRAIDIVAPGVNLHTKEMLWLFFRCGFRGIGRGQGITHLDVRERNAGFWRYTGTSRLSDEQAREEYDRYLQSLGSIA